MPVRGAANMRNQFYYARIKIAFAQEIGPIAGLNGASAALRAPSGAHSLQSPYPSLASPTPIYHTPGPYGDCITIYRD
ncbi:unnamed protein product [Toxocara canis]|uniref:Uncharacterized protein n=1 Tax=Toxocara canis TaxID=6265 RepID=A0A183UKN6_TOXCA|nr:unnamed protein product [Toxocara canis]